MANYCTQEDVEGYLNIDFTANPDDTVAEWIASATAKINDKCNRDFDLHEDAVENYDGKGRWGDLEWQRHKSLTLKNRPVISVDQVDVNGTIWVEGTHYEVYEDEARIVCIPDTRYFPKKAKVIEVTYDHGYASPPQAIKDACIWLVFCEFQEMLKFSEAGVAQSVSIEGESMNFPEVRLSPEKILAQLTPYVKWGF